MARIPDIGDFPGSLLAEEGRDAARRIAGSAPNFGQPLVPHVATTQAFSGTAARTYRRGWDEALRDNPQNAIFMRSHAGIRECIESRKRGTCLLPWNVVPENKHDRKQQEAAETLENILRRTPSFLDFRDNLQEALWYGRSGNSLIYDRQRVHGRWRTCIASWTPMHGDKLVFRYDDGTRKWKQGQVGIRVHAGMIMPDKRHFEAMGIDINRVEPAEAGLAMFLTDDEKDLLPIHSHIIEDGAWEDPLQQGSIFGVGIRSRIYWTWYQMVEALAWVMEYLERAAFGVDVWFYPANNAEAKSAVEAAAHDRVTGGGARSPLLVPIAGGDDPEVWKPYHLEPGMAGADQVFRLIQDYFGHQIKRYILGQVLTSEAEATGLGSGVAEAHLATFADIVRFDAQKLSESMTREVLHPLLQFNFPEYRDHMFRFVINTEAENMGEHFEALKIAYQIGLKMKAEDVYKLLAFSQPEQKDEVIQRREQEGATDTLGSALDMYSRPVEAARNAQQSRKRKEVIS